MQGTPLTGDRPVEEHGSGWTSLWDSGENALWDRGKPSPALVDAVEQEQELVSPFVNERRKKVLVPVIHSSWINKGTSMLTAMNRAVAEATML